MGDYSDFFNVRGPNKLTRLKVTYRSWRVEHHDYKTQAKACEMQTVFRNLFTVKRATIMKRKIKT